MLRSGDASQGSVQWNCNVFTRTVKYRYANSQGVVEEQYVFLKRVCQLLVQLGISQLAPLWVNQISATVERTIIYNISNVQQNTANFKRPDTFELYLSVVLEFTKHDSQVSQE